MKVEMLMPQMGESIAEATILKWLKSVGETVAKDEIILEISTDKVDSEIPAPAAGTLVEVLYQEGDVVPVKTVIAAIDTEGGAASVTATPSPEPQVSASIIESIDSAQQESGQGLRELTPEPPRVVLDDASDNRFFSPLVKGLASKHGIPLSELAAVTGSGVGNRLTKRDFMDYLESRQSNGSSSKQTRPERAEKVSTPQAPPPQKAKEKESRPRVDIPGANWQADGTKLVPMDNMRKAIAEHMVRSKQTSAHVYSIQEVDVTRIATWRKKNKAEFKQQEGFNLSFTPFFLEAAVKGLLQFPYMNSSVEGTTVILKKNINLGCAVALGDTGLIVPVIRNAEEKNLVGIARSLNDLASRARSKKLMPDEVMGGTFTVTNPGVFGTMIGTPIINQPQVGILCLGAIEKRPVVVNRDGEDTIAIRDRCYLTISYDHRIIDGALGGQYLRFIVDYLQDWDTDRSLY